MASKSRNLSVLIENRRMICFRYKYYTVHVHRGNKLSPATATLFSLVKTKKTRVKGNADGCGLLFLSYNFMMGDISCSYKHVKESLSLRSSI